jgi:hypothetical protein
MGAPMTRAILFACVLAASLSAGCGPAPPDVAAAERAVYDSFFAAQGGERNLPVYVVAATDAAWFAENPFRAREWGPPWLADLGGIPMDLVEELYRVNRTSAPIAEDPPPANVLFLPADYAPPDPSSYDWRCTAGEDRPSPGTDGEPDCDFQAYFTVSRVVFSRDRRHALLKYLHHCLDLCASEVFAAFEWDGHRWRQIGTRMLWIS